MLVDSHCHLQDSQFESDRDEVLDRARQAGVSAFVVIGTDLESSWRAVDNTTRFGSPQAFTPTTPKTWTTVLWARWSGWRTRRK